MFIRRITELRINSPRLLLPSTVFAHSTTCPTMKKKVCPGSGKIKKPVSCPTRKPVSCPTSRSSGGGSTGGPGTRLVRAKRSGKCRFGFIPDEWFLFLHPKTGVSGPYLLMLGLANYAASKEILVMEHEYYSGLSVALVLYIITTRLGSHISAALDAGVDEIQGQYQKSQDEEIATYKNVIKECKLGQIRAQGQQMLIAAKKENIALQLEAVYRERLMLVHRTVQDRMKYHMNRARTEARIQQRWMIQWILENVNKSITPEFQRQALSSAIKDLASVKSM